MDVTTVLTIYNEEDNIEPQARDILAAYDGVGLDGEVVMVDDGSEDRTGEIVSRLAEEDERLVAIHHGENLGRSFAVRSGFDVARGEVIIVMDSDRQYETREIPRFVAKVREGWDAVSGRRDHREDNLDRKLVSKVYNIIIIKWLLRTPVEDQNSGLKAFRADFVKGMGFEPTGFIGLHRFILPLAQLKGGRVIEIPCTHYPRPAGETYIHSHTIPFITLRDFVRFLGVYVIPARRVSRTTSKGG